MITEAILKFLGGVMTFVVGLFPTVTVPAFVTEVTSYISSGLGVVGAFGNMLPVTALRLSFVFLLACLTAALAIRLFRMVLSALTGGGGGAA